MVHDGVMHGESAPVHRGGPVHRSGPVHRGGPVHCGGPVDGSAMPAIGSATPT